LEFLFTFVVNNQGKKMKIRRFFLLAAMASLTIGTMSAQQSDVICSEQVALENLAAYIDTMRTADPHVKLFYTNLVNNPTHSYRIEHHDVGFNGCTGRVDEKVVLADGTNGVGFYKWMGGSLGAGRAIVPASVVAGSSREFLSFDFDEDITAIESLSPALSECKRACFDLQGRRVPTVTSHPSTLSKGLYIMNGQKVLIK
jgi:hypothetical protein